MVINGRCIPPYAWSTLDILNIVSSYDVLNITYKMSLC